MLTNEQIISSVKQAFSPLPCSAEIFFDDKLQYKVTDYNQTTVRSGEVALRHAQDPELLECVLRQVRARIQNKGFVLNQPAFAAAA
ncbi:MAG TPA: hypothetical protein VFR09_06980 [Alphaproteobacteria bacterium]|nr:hypothetical protein [Alphaproteobacteria bacterium]